MESKSSSLFVSWQPGNYQRTAKRTEDAFQACNDIVACFQERARVERQYAQQLSEWSNKWKPVVDSSKISNCNTYDERGNDLISKSCPNYYWNTTVILMVCHLLLLLLPQVLYMALLWRLGSVFCPPPTGLPPYTPPSVAPWCRRMGTGSGPGRRTPSTRSYLGVSRSPTTLRRGLHVLRSRGPNDLKRSDFFPDLFMVVTHRHIN